MDLFAKIEGAKGYFGNLRAIEDHSFTRPILDDPAGPIMTFMGKKSVMWSVNNYLGLLNHPDVMEELRGALERYGIGNPMGSRMMTGNTNAHLELESALAGFLGKESSYVCNYGYMGVIGTMSALAAPRDTIVLDKLSHACLIDGGFLSKAKLRFFRHNDMESLEATLRHINRDRTGGILIVCEGVYGMTGDIAPLADICALAEKYEARIFVDDAHGFGVMGNEGRGVGDLFGVQDKIDIYFGTFAKAFAAIGGVIAAEKRVREWISYNARSQVFAKSLPMIYVMAIRKTLELVEAADDRRASMWKISRMLKTGLRDLGYCIGNGESPICNVYVRNDRDNPHVMKMIYALRDWGIFITAVIEPVIPVGLCMFRMIPTAMHTEEHVEMTLKAFAKVRAISGLNLDLTDAEIARLRKLFGSGYVS